MTKKELDATLDTTDIIGCGTPAETRAQVSLTVCRNSPKHSAGDFKDLKT